MQAIILAAGLGTRLRPLTDTCPKSMLKINNRSILEYLILLLKKYGVNEIAINLHHKPEIVENYFGDGSSFKIKIKYSYEEELLGTAGAVKKLSNFFKDTFYVVYGDLLTVMNLKKMLSFHKSRNAKITVALYEVPNPQDCGIADIDENCKICKFIEKPRAEEIFTNVASTGIFVVEPEIINYIPENKFFDFGKDLFPLLIEKNIPIYGYKTDEYLIDIGTIESFKKAEKDLIEKRLHFV